ncbi:hypothetical protein ACWYAI_11115 [Klebsiella quasipneumoniae]
MTKSTITRERLELIANFHRAMVLPPSHDEIEELARMALAAMDSEPVAYTDERNLGYIDRGRETAYLWGKQNSEASDVALYRHAQPAPEYPEVLPCSVFLEPGLRFGKGVKTRLVLEAIQRRAEHYAELEAMTPEERAEYDAGIEAFKAMLPQPATASEPLAVTDDELNAALQLHRLTVDGHSQLSDAFRAGFRYARRTTPQPAPIVSAELLHTAASAIEDLLTTKDRTGACVWFDLPFRLRSAANAQPVTVVPDRMTAIVKDEAEYVEGWNACRAAMLAAAPHEVGDT